MSEQQTELLHGTMRMYTNQKCRCEFCRNENSLYQRLYHCIRKKQGRPYKRPTWRKKKTKVRFGNGWISYKDDTMTVGIRNKEVCKITPYELASVMIDEGKLARSFSRLPK